MFDFIIIISKCKRITLGIVQRSITAGTSDCICDFFLLLMKRQIRRHKTKYLYHIYIFVFSVHVILLKIKEF